MSSPNHHHAFIACQVCRRRQPQTRRRKPGPFNEESRACHSGWQADSETQREGFEQRLREIVLDRIRLRVARTGLWGAKRGVFFPELNEPARPAADGPRRVTRAGRRRVGARCGQSDEDKIGGNRRIGVHDRSCRGLATAGSSLLI